ncbi:unnamed protein product [Phytomonas sp. Hart1]|nr:unnamed protein product [Phytomonas sp. Hart1]|eukprot:CCW65980.1 unnamed protein product [Phytomonas sp. isolate Hart1]
MAAGSPRGCAGSFTTTPRSTRRPGEEGKWGGVRRAKTARRTTRWRGCGGFRPTSPVSPAPPARAPSPSWATPATPTFFCARATSACLSTTASWRARRFGGRWRPFMPRS